jgi:hypothetical protein
MMTVRALRTAAAGLLGLAVLAVPAARAQPAGGGEGDKGKIVPGVPGGEEFKPGKTLTLTRRNGPAVSGRVVWDDGKTVYLRTRPGSPPVAVPHGDIEKREPTPAAAGQTRWANLDPAWAKQSEEIHEVEVIEGSRRTVRYVTAPWLSPTEKQRLAELEAAENQAAMAEGAADLRAQILNEQRDLETRRAQALAQFYNYSTLTSLGFFPATVITYPQPSYAAWGYGGLGYDGGVGFPYYLGGLAGYRSGILAAGLNRWRAGWETLPAVSPADAGPEAGTLMKALTPELVKEMGPEARAAAQKTLAEARRHVVYQDGRIVAVRLGEPGAAVPAKNKQDE